jgi:catechol 2,3-dioxygenase-like lactoylglutathione lyase family enzyme
MCARRASKETALEICGLDHIYISVTDFAVSEAFYDAVMGAFGFRKGDRAIAGESHAHYFNRHLQYSIRPARSAKPHDPYAPGLHHICFQTPTRADVDSAYQKLRALGIASRAPAVYPEYSEDYYATFFEDPDGLRLEVLVRTPDCDEISRIWDELTVFTNPIAEWRSRQT